MATSMRRFLAVDNNSPSTSDSFPSTPPLETTSKRKKSRKRKPPKSKPLLRAKSNECRSKKKKARNGKTKRPKRAKTAKAGALGLRIQINVGHTVRLTDNRIAFVKFKGRVKFSIGIWYGLEIYDSFTTTRHNGAVYGKRYFNCPRNKGLFAKHNVIVEVIKPCNLKKALRDLERKQIRKQKTEDKKRGHVATLRIEAHIQHNKSSSNRTRHKNHRHKRSLLSMFQGDRNGNGCSDRGDHSPGVRKIQRDFKRFSRLSFRALDNPEIRNMVRRDNSSRDIKEGSLSDDEIEKMESERMASLKVTVFTMTELNQSSTPLALDDDFKFSMIEDGGDDDGGDIEVDHGQKYKYGVTPKVKAKGNKHGHVRSSVTMLSDGVDIDYEAWDSHRERPILELIGRDHEPMTDEFGIDLDDEEEEEGDDEDVHSVRLFYPLDKYIREWDWVFDRGLLIVDIDNISKYGRALILDCGIQGDNGWYIQSINGEDITKYSEEDSEMVINRLVPDIGYDIRIGRVPEE